MLPRLRAAARTGRRKRRSFRRIPATAARETTYRVFRSRKRSRAAPVAPGGPDEAGWPARAGGIVPWPAGGRGRRAGRRDLFPAGASRRDERNATEPVLQRQRLASRDIRIRLGRLGAGVDDRATASCPRDESLQL